jgi:hypothetical protein
MEDHKMKHTFNSACAVIDILFGKMNLEIKNTPSRTVFFVNGKAAAQYKESSGTLAFYPYGIELQKARGARTVAHWNFIK